MDPKYQHTTMSTNLSEKVFDAILNNIKVENYSLFNDELSDLEDSASIAYKSIGNEDKKQQDEMRELATTSYEKDINVSTSNSQEPTDTELIDDKIVSLHTSSHSTVLPITKISPKLTPHTCLKHCFWCSSVFRVLDRPSHIGQILKFDKQNEFLKIEPSLCIDSCLCDLCWRLLEKTYKSNKPDKTNGETFYEKRTRLLERPKKKRKKKSQARTCSIHFCSEPYCHKMTVNECENIENMLATFESCGFVFLRPKKQTSDFLTYPYCLCKVHNPLIMVMSSCQICCSKLNEPLNTADWSMYKTWNLVLIENNLPLILRPGMFICMSCREHISKSNPGFSTDDLPHLRKYVAMSHSIRLKLYGEPQHNLFDICQTSTYGTCPIVVPKIKEKKERVCSTKVKFSDPLVTVTCHYEVDYDENDTESITSTALLNVAEQNLVTPKLEPQDEGLNFVKLEEHFKTFRTNKPTDQSYNFYTDSTLNTGGIEMTNSLNENVYDIPENILTEQNSPSNLTDSNISNNFSYAAANHVLKHIDNVKMSENDSEIIDSRQVVSVHNEIKNNQSKLNYHNIICNVAQDKSSTDLKEVNQCLEEINTVHKTVNFNATNNGIYSCIAAVESPNVIGNPVSIKRKQNNVICDTISNKNVKKTRLNGKYSSYANNSTHNNSNKSYGNKNIRSSKFKSKSILNMISNCKNKYILNSDFSGVQDLSSDVDEESLKLHSSCLLKDIESNTYAPSNDTKKGYSLDPSCASPLQFKHLLKKIPYSCNRKKYSRK